MVLLNPIRETTYPKGLRRHKAKPQPSHSLLHTTNPVGLGAMRGLEFCLNNPKRNKQNKKTLNKNKKNSIGQSAVKVGDVAVDCGKLIRKLPPGAREP